MLIFLCFCLVVKSVREDKHFNLHKKLFYNFWTTIIMCQSVIVFHAFPDSFSVFSALFCHYSLIILRLHINCPKLSKCKSIISLRNTIDNSGTLNYLQVLNM